MVAGELAGEWAAFAIGGAVGGRREEKALLWFADFIVNIIYLIGRNSKANKQRCLIGPA
jgi:hypothetical protein